MIEKKKEKRKKKKKKAIKFTESAAFCRVGRVTGNNNKFLLGLSYLIDISLGEAWSDSVSVIGFFAIEYSLAA